MTCEQLEGSQILFLAVVAGVDIGLNVTAFFLNLEALLGSVLF